MSKLFKMAALLAVVASTTMVPGIVFGGAPGRIWDMGAMPPETLAVYFDNAAGGARGVPVNSGDFNGDGFLDIAATPFSASTLGRQQNGTAEIIFGDGTLGRVIDTATYTGPRLVVHGATNFSLLGVEFRAADMDGDGFTDLILGSSHGKFQSTADRAGEVVILFGNAQWGDTITELDIADLPPGQRAKFILGQRTIDRLGSWLTVGDFDGDDELDLMVGMDLSDGPDNNRPNCGAAVIAWSAGVQDLQQPFVRVGDVATSSSFTVIYGRDANDLTGATNEVGDLDGDGQLDLIVAAGVTRSGLAIGTLGYPGSGGGDGPLNDRINAGEATIFWSAPVYKNYRTLDMANLPEELITTTLYGKTPTDYFGEELVVGDMTGDGIMDLIVGALTYEGAFENGAAGGAWLFPGGSMLRNSESIDLASPPANFIVEFACGVQNGIGGDTVELYDVNGDGFADLFYGIPQSSPQGRGNAGSTTVIFGGQSFPRLPARVIVTDTTSPPFMTGVMHAADAGDLFSYSTGLGDINGDGVTDYIVNAMQGDGFMNAVPNAGEFYVVDGDLLPRYAAAPVNLREVAEGNIVARWDSSQPIYGPVAGYLVTYEVDDAFAPFTLRVVPPAFGLSDLEMLPGGPQSGRLTSVQALMTRADESETTSVVSFFNPPIEITITPTPTATPTATATPVSTVTPTTTATPTPSATSTPTATPTVTPTPTPTPDPVIFMHDFEDGGEGWVFGSTAAFPAPFARVTSTSLELDVAGTAPYIPNTFGFWQNAEFGRPVAPSIAAGSLLEVRAEISSGSPLATTTPGIGLRVFNGNHSESDLFLIESTVFAGYSPDAAGRGYRWFLSPSTAMEQVGLAFDMRVFENGTLSVGTIALEDIKLIRHAPVAAGRGTSSLDNWEARNSSGVFADPAFNREQDGSLSLRGTADDEIVFGYWHGHARLGVTVQQDALYRATWQVSTDAANVLDTPVIRLRLNSSSFMSAVVKDITSTVAVDGGFETGVPRTFTTYLTGDFELRQEDILPSFDYLFVPDLQDDSGVTIRIHSFTLEELEMPSLD